jgi:hypothetical protein
MKPHKIRIKLKDDSFSMNFGRHYKFLISYYFRERGLWTENNKEIDVVTKRLDGKLSNQPRNSSFFC